MNAVLVRESATTICPVPPARRSNRLRRVDVLAKYCLLAAVLIPGGTSETVSHAAETGSGSAVFNEIMYHPPEGTDGLQFIELHNPGTHHLNLSGWSVSKGLEFVFPRQTTLAPGGHTVVCRDVAAFRRWYGEKVNIAGVFAGKLSRKGCRLELADAQGQLVDIVEYGDRAPWPLGADGYGASLERICPAETGDDPANWAASQIESGAIMGGTPGRPNTWFSPVPLPTIAEVQFSPPHPDTPIPVSAAVADSAGVDSVVLAWQAWQDGSASRCSEIALSRTTGDDRRGVYAGSIPAQPEGRLIRFVIRARSVSGVERLCPAPTEPRPTFSCATFVNTNTARVPFLHLLPLGAVERRPGSRRAQAAISRWGRNPSGTRENWGSLAVYLPPGGEPAQLFDHVHVRPRKGGVKVHFHKDQPFRGMTGINVIFEKSPRWLLSEPLAYDLYRLAGVPAPLTQHVRLWADGQPLGYYLLIEQPNRTFLRRNGRDPDGDLFKLLWYARGLIGQHEKKTNPHTGHGELLQVIEGLNRTSGAAQWDFIQQHFNVDAMIDYYAVNMCIQNWDGFWNNYFAYQSPRSGGKWEVFPWDEDKTWGEFDGGHADWYEMPLDSGMNGSSRAGGERFGSGPWGGPPWWRPPGHFSGPLLANQEFRRRFLVRLRELCETVFTPERMTPLIDGLRDRLEEEISVSANLRGQAPAFALRQFHADIESFRKQVVHRREFILEQLAREPNLR